MKKLLTLVLLLGLATVTQAAVIGFEAVGGTVVDPGDTVTIQLKADTDCSGWSFHAVASSIVMSSFGSLTAGAGATVSAGPYIDYGNSGILPAGLLFDTYDAYYSTAASSGTVLMSFQVTIPTNWNGSAITIAPLAAGETFKDLYGSTYTAVASYGNLAATNVNIGGVTLTPEPITLTLLGLGGLALVRRRR